MITQQKLLADLRTAEVVNLADYRREKRTETQLKTRCAKWGTKQ